jgi:hypothetical protein
MIGSGFRHGLCAHSGRFSPQTRRNRLECRLGNINMYTALFQIYISQDYFYLIDFFLTIAGRLSTGEVLCVSSLVAPHRLMGEKTKREI